MPISHRAFALGLFLLFYSLALPALAQPVSPILDNDTDFRVSPEVFPIFPWDTLPAKAHFYEEARAAGFNLAGFVRPENLDLVQSAGLKAFVSDPSINPRANEKATDEEIAAAVKSLTDRTAHHPATFAYHLLDEPAPSFIPTVVRWTTALQTAAPNAIIHTNLFPIFATPTTQSATDKKYDDYLNAFLSAAHPKAFSYDNYPLLDDGSIRPNFFPNLEAARRASLANHVPLWNVVLANSHFRYADPTPGGLRFQVFSALAYGSRGIGYFTFTARDRGNYRNSAIDLFGHRTPTFDMLREVNLQLHRLAPTLTQLTSVNVFHHPQVPPGSQGLDSSKFLKDIKGAGSFCVGEFEDAQGRGAVLVVNKDIHHSTQLTIVPKTKTTIQRVSSYTATTRPWAAEDNWLPPGGAVLLLLRD